MGYPETAAMAKAPDDLEGLFQPKQFYASMVINNPSILLFKFNTFVV